MAAALGDDASFSTTMATSLGNRLRVDVNSQSLNSTQQTNALTCVGIKRFCRCFRSLMLGGMEWYSAAGTGGRSVGECVDLQMRGAGGSGCLLGKTAMKGA